MLNIKVEAEEEEAAKHLQVHATAAYRQVSFHFTLHYPHRTTLRDGHLPVTIHHLP